jgi:serine/threonine protein kinase
MHEEPPRISLKNPEIPKPLEDIVLRCLKKTPEERYQSVDELLEALKVLI